MENHSDVEDIIPPTPETQFNKFCSRISKSVTSKSSMSKKDSKPVNSCKRKRIISPDLNKVKQKSKQLTLFNFLLKTSNTSNLSLSSDEQNNSSLPVKINLLNKLEDTSHNKYSDTCDSVQKETLNCRNGACCSKSELFDVNEGISMESDNAVSKDKEFVRQDKISYIQQECPAPQTKLVIENNMQIDSSLNCESTITNISEKDSLCQKLISMDNTFVQQDEIDCVQWEFPALQTKKGIENVLTDSFANCVPTVTNVSKNHISCQKLRRKIDTEVQSSVLLQPKSTSLGKNEPVIQDALVANKNNSKVYKTTDIQSEVSDMKGKVLACDRVSSLSPERLSISSKVENTINKSILPKLSSDIDNQQTEICNEVALLKLNAQINDGSLNHIDETSLNTENAEVKNAAFPVEEKPDNSEKTLSWLNDFDWENSKENFDESFNVSILDASSNNKFIHSEMEEGNYVKFKVKSIQRDTTKNEVMLHVIPTDGSKDVKVCLLKGFWADSRVTVGDIVHILKPSFNAVTTIDNDAGFLVINPDFLISSTAVVSTLFCMRKAVLNYILPQWSSGNNIMMIGSFIHEIFQKSVNSHARSSEEILKITKLELKKRENVISMCCQDMSESEIEEKISKYIPNILHWIRTHCSFTEKNSFSDISVTQVEDIEENVWCPKYGIKGKIDMTVKAHCPNQAQSKIMPLELKTGRPSFSVEHIGQVHLYSLMMEERSKEVSNGLLLYLRDKVEMKPIMSNHHSKRGLIQLRNELASFVFKWMSSESPNCVEIEDCYLPEPINNQRLCNKCPYLLPCSVYQKAFKEENKLNDSHAMKKIVPSSTNHLSTSHMEYFVHWSCLLLLETNTTAEVKAFWTEDAIAREKKSTCLSSLFLDKNSPPRPEKSNESFHHTFIRSPADSTFQGFINSCLKEGDYVAISSQNDPDEVAVAMGYIIAVRDYSVVVAIERNLSSLPRLRDNVFRIDKMVSNSATASVRNNLMLLMLDESSSERLRKLIIDQEPPRFLQTLSKQIVLTGRQILKSLNKNQQKAVLKAIMSEDYFLIKGMPGTGKTSTIVALVRLLVKMNVSVLLASYTHSAIDNILLKLKDYVDFVRIGPKYRIHPGILEYSFENLTQDYNSVDQFSKFMKEKMVVATTCLSINHAIFKLRKFDFCIVDEAAQINQIACLGPLFLAKKFILVGDDKQLPPLVLNAEARKKGMQESLFLRLQNSTNCIDMTIQYRMNREIMRLCNELTYNGKLECGSDIVANAVLQLPQKPNTLITSPWLLKAFDPCLTKSVVFLNTDHCETSNLEKSKVAIEADIVFQLLQFLFKCNVPDSDIGIICPYRKQVELIQNKLKELNPHEVEVNTVDQYQGRDKNIIILSCVRPGDSVPKEEKTGVILNDERRLNVAVTRAKTKLIFIGNKTVLCNYKPFENLINSLKSYQFLDIF